MARKKNAFPTLRFHKPTKQFCCNHGGKRVNFGRDQTAAEIRFREFVGKLTRGELLDSPKIGPGALVGEVIKEFLTRQRPRWTDTRDLARIDTTCRLLGEFAGSEPAAEFRRSRLEEFRRWLITLKGKHGKPYGRTWINYLIAVVKQVWTWAADECLIPEETAAKLRRLKPLGRGQGGREKPRVLPADPEAVMATLPELTPMLAAMTRVQQLCGARPGEICAMRRRDVSIRPDEPVAVAETSIEARATDGIWFFIPNSHKTAGRGKFRVLALGPRAQAILWPLLADIKPDEFVFHDSRGRGIDPKNYHQAVERAIERVRRKGKQIATWRPGQLRHSAATAARAMFGREAAGEFLGHAGLSLVDRYAERALEVAAKVAREMG